MIFLYSECACLTLFPCPDVIPVLLHDGFDMGAFATQNPLSIWVGKDMAFRKDDVFTYFGHNCLKLYLLLNPDNSQELCIKID